MRIYVDPSVANLLGPALRSARKRSRERLTQGQLAGRIQVLGLDIDRTAVSRIESQQRALGDVELFFFLKALRIDLRRLFDFFHQPASELEHYRDFDLLDDSFELVAEPKTAARGKRKSAQGKP